MSHSRREPLRLRRTRSLTEHGDPPPVLPASRAPVDERSLRSRIDAARGIPPLDLPTALALVRERHKVDCSNARARAGFARGHLIDVVLALPGGRNTPEEAVAAEALVELVLGEARRADWIDSVTSLAAPRGGLLKVVQAGTEDDRFFPLVELAPTIEAAVHGIHAGLPSEPLWALGGEQRWYLFELDVEPAHYYAAQADVALVSTFMPELVKCFLSGASFASTRFSRAGELFAYLKYESRERDPQQALARRRMLEDALDAELVSERAGRVIGSGMGVVYSYVNLALSRVERSIDVLQSVAKRVGLSRNTWIQFFDTSLADAWVGLTSDAPTPPTS
jgi:hypothetical protein